MKFIRKRNLQEAEEILYTPKLHWFNTVKHLGLFLLVFIALFLFWRHWDNSAGSKEFYASPCLRALRHYLWNVFLGTIALAMAVFVWRVFQYLCTEFGVTNKRLILKQGVLRTVVTEIPIDRIESIRCVKGILGMLFNFGTIRVSGVGGTAQIFKMIARPYSVRRKIVNIIEKNKTITVVHGELPRPEPVEGEPIYRYGTFVRVMGA
jgi:uncharacterized membrane protein YdbT with pleckstrin-like domain